MLQEFTYIDVLAEMPVELAYAGRKSWPFAPMEVTWGRFVELIHGEAEANRHADILKGHIPTFVPARLEAEAGWYEKAYERACREYHNDLKRMPPANGDWFAAWVTASTISRLYMWVLDIDCGMTEEQLRAALDGHEALYWTTKRSTPDHLRWRVVLVLKQPFVVEQHGPAAAASQYLWKRAYLEAAKRLDLDVDTSCTDVCRRANMPVGPKVIIGHVRGQAFDLQAVIDSLPSEEPQRSKKKASSSTKGLPSDWKDVLDAIPNGDRVRRQVFPDM